MHLAIEVPTICVACIMHFIVLVAAAAAYSPPIIRATQRPTALQTGALRCAAPQCGSGPKWADDEFDSVALYGDTCVLLAYGTVQGMIDSMFAPLAALDGDIGEAFQAVPMAPLQGIALAVMWVGITYAIGGYKTDATRTLPSKEALLPLGIAWTGAASVVVSAFVLMGLPLFAEADFIAGLAVVVGGWRYFLSLGLPFF